MICCCNAITDHFHSHSNERTPQLYRWIPILLGDAPHLGWLWLDVVWYIISPVLVMFKSKVTKCHNLETIHGQKHPGHSAQGHEPVEVGEVQKRVGRVLVFNQKPKALTKYTKKVQLRRNEVCT